MPRPFKSPPPRRPFHSERSDNVRPIEFTPRRSTLILSHSFTLGLWPYSHGLPFAFSISFILSSWSSCRSVIIIFVVPLDH